MHAGRSAVSFQIHLAFIDANAHADRPCPHRDATRRAPGRFIVSATSVPHLVQSGRLKVRHGQYVRDARQGRDLTSCLRTFGSGDQAPSAHMNVPGVHDIVGEGGAFDHTALVMDWHLDFPAIRCRSAPQFAEAADQLEELTFRKEAQRRGLPGWGE